ncbi:peptidoglycan editing factor PgeF [Candidatus Latescibacterota bacterium]
MNKISPVIPTVFPSDQVICGFTTRYGGVSLSPFDELNLCYETIDEQNSVKKNYDLLCCLLGVEAENIRVMEQAHTCNIDIVESGGISKAADGLVTSTPGIILGIQIADCIPLLLYDPVHGVTASVHCGWRSLVNGIAEKAVNIMVGHRSGTLGNNNARPADIIAAMGPSAGPCCYEIGDEVAMRLHSGSVVERDSRLFGDLRTELALRLMKAGLKEHSIEVFSDCTICNSSLYYSHRRDGSLSGRMLGYIMIKSN